MKQKDVFWVTVPYADFSAEKHRPALIVSNDEYNKESEDVLLCAITSNQAAKPYSIKLSQNDLVEGTLPLESRIRADKMISVSKTMLARKIGTVSNKLFADVTDEIRKLIR